MARSPQKTCPSLFRLFEDAEPALLSAFLARRDFEKLAWLDRYRFEPDDPYGAAAAGEMLHQEKKDQLNPLEAEASRIFTIAGTRGQYILEGFSRTKLDSERAAALMNQRDELARSLWVYLYEQSLFEAAENSLHLRLYRRYDTHYQTFMAEPSIEGGPQAGSAVLDALLADLNVSLDRGEGYSIDQYVIPEEDDEPAAEMYLHFHPDPPTSVREIDDEGNRSSIYFRPPGEAMIVYTPSTGRVHVRAGNRTLRHIIAERFIETALDQRYSNQPVDFQAYDISQFLTGLKLDTPEFDDVTILRAQVIRADVSIGNLANRLSLSTTIDQDISGIIDEQPGLSKTFACAIAIRFVEIAVRYRRSGKEEAQTLDFTLTDRNTGSLLSLDDPFERVLAHRLLRHWKILRDGRAPTDGEGFAIIPALLEIWDMGADRVSGNWLLSRGIDGGVLTELGFLVPAGWDDGDLIDDEDEIGPVAAEAVVHPDGADLSVSTGHTASGGNPERYRLYRVREGWVAEHLEARLGDALDEPEVEEITDHLLHLGTLGIGGRQVPVYLARGLDREKVRAGIDTELRARHHLGVGLVLQAGRAAGSYLAANLLIRLADLIEDDEREIALSADRLRAAFERDHVLARGGQTVELKVSGENLATLFVPGKGTIDIGGANRVKVIRRLVDAYPMAVATADLIKGMEGQSLANIFGQPLWNKLKAAFVRKGPNRGREIAI